MQLFILIKRPLRKIINFVIRSYYSLGRGAECNICRWQGKNFFSDKWQPHTICPKCGSQVRHRLLAAALSFTEGLSYQQIVKDKAVLHFAPEPFLRPLIQEYAATYLTADFQTQQGVDINLDISDMASIQDNSWDLLIACDVLEHVPAHLLAMREIYRVLRPGGYAILTVPQKDNLEQTFEDPAAATPQERERLFGQADHIRIYGNDFPSLLEATGFEVTVVDEGNFPPDAARQYVLFPIVLSSHPLATNFRKIFFARKVVR